jgi:glycosyltransferase involved in cell wall biosynthesis
VISVIIPTYNRRDLLSATLASVFAQTGVDSEVIVVDDGSTDDTLVYLRALPVQVVALPHAGRSAVARNAGLARAHGDLIAFLDSDDLWEPHALAALASALAAAPQAGFAFCDYTYFGPLTSGGHLPAEARTAAGLYARLLNGNFLVVGGVLVRRAVLDALGPFDVRCAFADDWDYWLRLAAHAPGVYVDERLVRLRAHAAALSYQPGGAVYVDNVYITGKALAYCRAHRPALLPLAQQAHRRCRQAAARYHWRRGAWGAAARALWGWPHAG